MKLHTLAIDPGKHTLAAAWGVNELEGTALWAGFESPCAINRWVNAWCAETATRLVIERPLIREGAAVRKMDILDLTLTVGAASVGTARGVEYVWPNTWGAAGKDTPEAKARTQRRVLRRLSDVEAARVKLPGLKELDHNVWDAVGIWLWSQGRYGP